MIEQFNMSYFDLVRIYKGEQVPNTRSYKRIEVTALRKTYDNYNGTQKILFETLRKLPSLVEESVKVKKWIIREIEELPEIYNEAEQEEDGRSIIFTWRNK